MSSCAVAVVNESTQQREKPKIEVGDRVLVLKSALLRETADTASNKTGTLLPGASCVASNPQSHLTAEEFRPETCVVEE